MCGIVGLAQAAPDQWRGGFEFFAHLQRVAQMRGTDGAGAAFFDGETDPFCIRAPGAATKSLHQSPDWAIAKACRWKTFMGHTRAESTKGTSADPHNLHPFHRDGWWGTHNGYVRPLQQWAARAGLPLTSTTASEALIAWRSVLSLDDWRHLMGWIDRRWATVMINEATPHIIELASGGMPLCFGVNSTKKVIAWASLPEYIESAALQSGTWPQWDILKLSRGQGGTLTITKTGAHWDPWAIPLRASLREEKRGAGPTVAH